MTDTLTTFEHHILPNGDVVYYRDKDHAYFREIAHQKNHEIVGRGRLTGVSTVVKPYDGSPDGLLGWAAKLTCNGIAALASMETDDHGWVGEWVLNPEMITLALEKEGLTWKQQRDAAATRGTNVHKHALHALAMGDVPAYHLMTDEEKGYAKGVVNWWLEHNPDPLHKHDGDAMAECVVADLELGVAGRFDLIADIGGRITLVDCKTSGFLGPAMGVQLAGYASLGETCGYPPVDDMLILQVGEDGSYDPVPIEATEEDFLAAVDVYRRALVIRNQISRAKR